MREAWPGNRPALRLRAMAFPATDRHVELLAGFRNRGPKPDREHEILRSPQAGRECLLEGFTIDAPRGGSFLASLSLDADGRIRRYVAVYAEPVVP